MLEQFSPAPCEHLAFVLVLWEKWYYKEKDKELIVPKWKFPPTLYILTSYMSETNNATALT